VKLLIRTLNKLKRSRQPVCPKMNPLKLGRLSAWHNPISVDAKSKD